MRIVKSNERLQIEFIDEDNNVLIKILLAPNKLVWAFDKHLDYKNPVEIFRKDDKVLFNNLLWFMNQEYVKSNNNESQYDKDKNNFIWISENIDIVDRDNPGKNHTPRLIIKRTVDSLLIYPFTPISDNNSNKAVTFSYKATRYQALNLETETPIQDDMLLFYKKTFKNELIESNKNKKKEKN